MKSRKNESGITLIALTVMIIVIIILASISLYEGSNLIKEAKVQAIETDMLMIKGKVKGLVEEANAQTWADAESEIKQKRDEKLREFGLSYAGNLNIGDFIDYQEDESNIYTYNIISNEIIEQLGLTGIEDISDYQIVIDNKNGEVVDLIYINGISYKGERYFTLTQLKNVIEEN